jgi:hypothetical protein
MRSRLFYFIGGVVVALILFFIAWQLSIIPHEIKECKYDRYYEIEYCTGYNSIRFGIWRTAKFIDEHNWIISAIFAALVTAFTGLLYIATAGLKQSTDRLWREAHASTEAALIVANAAQKSANVAEQSYNLFERPYVIPEKIGQLYFALSPRGDLSGWVEFRIGNYGKTPAIVHRVGAKFIAVEIPVTTEKLSADNVRPGQTNVDVWNISTILVSGETHKMPLCTVPSELRNATIRRVNGKARVVLADQHELFLTVQIKYEDAATGVTREAATLWKSGLEGFERYPGKEYNRETVVA